MGARRGSIALGERGLHVHPAPCPTERDTCSPEAALRAAGGEITDCRGEPLRYNEPDPRHAAAA